MFDFTLLKAFYDETFQAIQQELRPLLSIDSDLDDEQQESLRKLIKEQMEATANISAIAISKRLDPLNQSKSPQALPPALSSALASAETFRARFLAFIECHGLDKCYRDVKQRGEAVGVSCEVGLEVASQILGQGFSCDGRHSWKRSTADASNRAVEFTLKANAVLDISLANEIDAVLRLHLPLCGLLKVAKDSETTVADDIFKYDTAMKWCRDSQGYRQAAAVEFTYSGGKSLQCTDNLTLIYASLNDSLVIGQYRHLFAPVPEFIALLAEAIVNANADNIKLEKLANSSLSGFILSDLEWIATMSWDAIREAERKMERVFSSLSEVSGLTVDIIRDHKFLLSDKEHHVKYGSRLLPVHLQSLQSKVESASQAMNEIDPLFNGVLNHLQDLNKSVLVKLPELQADVVYFRARNETLSKLVAQARLDVDAAKRAVYEHEQKKPTDSLSNEYMEHLFRSEKLGNEVLTLLSLLKDRSISAVRTSHDLRAAMAKLGALAKSADVFPSMVKHWQSLRRNFENLRVPAFNCTIPLLAKMAPNALKASRRVITKPAVEAFLALKHFCDALQRDSAAFYGWPRPFVKLLSVKHDDYKQTDLLVQLLAEMANISSSSLRLHDEVQADQAALLTLIYHDWAAAEKVLAIAQAFLQSQNLTTLAQAAGTPLPFSEEPARSNASVTDGSMTI